MMSKIENLDSEKIERFVRKIRRKLSLKGEISKIQARKLSGGYHNAVFLVTVETADQPASKFVVKVNQIRKLAYKIKAEFKVLKFLEGAPFAPTVLYFNPKSKILEAPVVVEDHVGEESLTNLPAISPEQFEQIAGIAAWIHSYAFKKYGTFPPKKKGTFFDIAMDDLRRSVRFFYGGYLRNLKTAPEDIARLKPEMENYIRRVRDALLRNRDVLSGNQFRLNHGDFGIGNMIKRGERVVLVDWESAQSGDSAGEILYFFIHSGISEGLGSRFLELYARNGGLVDDGFRRRFRIYPLLRLGGVLWALERASEDPGGGIEDIHVRDDLKIEKEFTPYKDLLETRIGVLEKELEGFRRT